MNLRLCFVFLLLLQLLPARAAVPADFIAAYAREKNFNGTVLAQEQGKVVFRRSFGLADIAFDVPNTPQTAYRIASITKAYTAVLVLQLVEQGRLDLHKTVGDYLPDYRGDGARVNLHQLLNHTSGLPNFDQVKDLQTALTQGVPAYQKPATPAQLVTDFCSGALAAAPGTAFDYNNCDYIVLGRILEVVSGKRYEQLLAESVLQPLGLKHTAMMRQGVIVPRLARSYMYREDLHALADDLPVYAENWYAAGGLYSNADEVLAFANALFGGKLLKPASLALMTTPGLDDYGYGVWSYDMTIDGRTQHIVKRPGRIMGAQAQLFRMCAADITLVLLANTDAVDLDEFAAAIARRALARDGAKP